MKDTDAPTREPTAAMGKPFMPYAKPQSETVVVWPTHGGKDMRTVRESVWYCQGYTSNKPTRTKRCAQDKPAVSEVTDFLRQVVHELADPIRANNQDKCNQCEVE